MEKHVNELSSEWSPFAKEYDPIKVGSIDGTDLIVHDKALLRASLSHYKPNDKVIGEPKCTIFVARLNPITNEETIHKYFSNFGRIKRLRLVRDIVTGCSKRYAFVEYKERNDAVKAYNNANKVILDERRILVDYELERVLKGWKPRRLGGGFGGKKESGQLRFGCRDKPWKKPFDLIRHERNYKRNYP